MSFPFHPSLSSLLTQAGWQKLTPIQEQSWELLGKGGHTLLLAPTGHGKTEAAILPILSRLLEEREAIIGRGGEWPKGFKALYITPLRALNRDLVGRLEEWGKTLKVGIEVRHGDTSQAQRNRQSKNPPDILITTPETLQLLLYGSNLRNHLKMVRFVVVDEVHDLVQNERGAQLSVALERIEEVVAGSNSEGTGKVLLAKPEGMFQRIGLSATVPEQNLVGNYLVGNRKFHVVRVDVKKEWELRVQSTKVTQDDKIAAAKLSIPPQVMSQVRAVRKIIDEHERLIVFQNTRDAAEMLASRLAILDEEEERPQRIGLHHGSLSADVRADVEDRFRAGELRALIATSSLELGIDVGAIDHVVQIHSPRSVSRMVQRLGRAGHALGQVSSGTLLAGGPEDVFECLAVAEMVARGELEPIPTRRGPLVVLANQIVALTTEYQESDPKWLLALLRRSFSFHDLDEATFLACYSALQSVGTTRRGEHKDVLERSGRGRRHFIDHIGMIPDERTYRVIDEATKRSIGTVDDSFVSSTLHPGATMVMAGRTWVVLEIQVEDERVRVAPAKELGSVPNWSGALMPVSFELAQEVGRIRSRLLADDATLPCDDETRFKAAMPLVEQRDLELAMPTPECIPIEVGGPSWTILVNLGTRGNEALGRITQCLLAQRLNVNIGLDCDAYRIRLESPRIRPGLIEEIWSTLDPDQLELLLGYLLRESPLLKHHAVYVAKQFGALPKQVDPNKFTKHKLASILADAAMGEEAMSRLLYDRFDLDAVSFFITKLLAGEIEVVEQELGPLSVLADQERRTLTAAPQANAELLRSVKERIEDGDLMLRCLQCKSKRTERAGDLEPRPKCRVCRSTMLVCIRPWAEDQLPLLDKDDKTLEHQEKLEKKRMHRGAQLVSNFGRDACIAMMARGVGPDTAARILQMGITSRDDHFWRAIIQAELQFSRTNAFWKKP